MIAMKTREDPQPGAYTWNPRKEIEYIKKALKQDHLYTDDEIRHLKSRLRDMYTVNKQLKRGNGFGRAS
jgi:hypothetical protein|tara:strand:- start:640 stop:846 length:207 start_codon:yes stop_codon:yes gene_type:complete